jgi:hypothetical protein
VELISTKTLECPRTEAELVKMINSMVDSTF